MGCDIHIAVEKKVGDKWVMVNRVKGEGSQRHYKRFAALAGVRGDGPEAKGMPDDISESSRLFVDEWESDGHSHSWDMLEDAIRIYQSALYEGEIPCDFPEYRYFGIDVADKTEFADYRIIYFFDN